MEALRQTIMSEVETTARKSRFGLFSQPPPVCVGDNTLFRGKQAKRGDDGKPTTKERNMLAGPNRSGVGSRDFIQQPTSVHVGDKYLDPEKVDYLYQQRLHGLGKKHGHDTEFKPASGFKDAAVLPYQHTDQNPLPRKRPQRDDTGRVVTHQANFTSNPMTRVDTRYFKFPKHVSDPYERKDLIASQERQLSQSKRGLQTYKSMSHGNGFFNKSSKVMGPQPLQSGRNPFLLTEHKGLKHESNFKPVRRGHGDPIGKYPKEPEHLRRRSATEVRARRSVKGEREEWKHSGNRRLSRPTPSISYSAVNLRLGR